MARKVLVGMLLLGALFIFGLATFYVENWQRYLGKGYPLKAKFPLVHTLDVGDIVRMSGVEVGAVEELTINTEAPPQRQVEAVLRINLDVTVRAEDKAVIKMASIFGGYYVALEPGDRNARTLGEDEEIVNTAVAPSVTEVVEESKVTLEEIREGFNGAFENIDTLTADLREGKGTLARLLTDEELAADMDVIVQGLKTASERLEKGEGVLGKLLMDEDMEDDLQKLLANLKETSEDLAEGKGLLGRLLTDEELSQDVDAIVSSLKTASERLETGEGVLGKLLMDQQMAEDVSTLITNLKDISDDMLSGEGTMAKLLRSDEVYQQLMSALDDLGEATGAIARGEGTIGKLVQDDEVYSKIKQLLQDVQGIVDAYREQSPVISVAGSLFGAF